MPSDLPAICEERLRLLREYADAASEYAARALELAAFVDAGQEVRANEAMRICQTAAKQTEKSRLNLYRHETDHGCARSASTSNIFET